MLSKPPHVYLKFLLIN